MHVEQKRTLVRVFLGHWPITEVDLHFDHVLEHVLFSHLREAQTPHCVVQDRCVCSALRVVTAQWWVSLHLLRAAWSD